MVAACSAALSSCKRMNLGKTQGEPAMLDETARQRVDRPHRELRARDFNGLDRPEPHSLMQINPRDRKWRNIVAQSLGRADHAQQQCGKSRISGAVGCKDEIGY